MDVAHAVAAWKRQYGIWSTSTLSTGTKAVRVFSAPPAFSADDMRAQWEPKWRPHDSDIARDAVGAWARIADEVGMQRKTPSMWRPPSETAFWVAVRRCVGGVGLDGWSSADCSGYLLPGTVCCNATSVYSDNA